MKYSVVIPVFNSERVIGETVKRTKTVFEAGQRDFEIILVNDGSRDASWETIRSLAEDDPNVVAINLLKNYGQHNANLCGFRHVTGDWVVTMDDDLQNPPEEISRLMEKAQDGYDVVIGKFAEKKHAWHRRVGSRFVQALNRRIFGYEKGLVLSNFRLIHRDVIDRICRYRTPFPYVPGLILMFSSNRANVTVKHQERTTGTSNYSLIRIVRMIMTILFNYSSYPLRIVAAGGMAVSFMSFILAIVYVVKTLLHGSSVPGWPSLVVLLSFFNGITLLMLGMLGEYMIRIINQGSSAESYYIKEIVGG